MGFAVIDFAADMLLIELLPWQKWLLIHMLELLPDDSLRFRTVIVLVARQNGKSTLSQVLALWFMYVYGLSLVLGTAQDLDTAEEVWQGAVDLVTEVSDEDDAPVRPELFELVDKVVQVNGKKALQLKTRKRWKVKAANRRAGRGLTGDLILLDELREHQSWDAWGSITKTTIAKAVALILAMSNAGDATSIVLRHLRKMAHARIGDPDGINRADNEDPDGREDDDSPTEEEWEEFDPDAAEMLEELADEEDDSLAIFEWSARPDRLRTDRDGWAEANPSLGYTITERTLASACATDPEWVFNTECLCRWSDGTLSGPFPPMTWDLGRWVPSKAGDPPPRIVGKVKACVVKSHDRRTTYIAYAGRRSDGLPQVELVAARAGDRWVSGWFKAPKRLRRVDKITGRKAGPEGQLLKELKKAGLPVEFWSGEDLGGWTGKFYDLVAEGTVDDDGRAVGLRHLPQPVLDIAAGNAVAKPAGERFVWDAAKSPVDIGPLIAATGAVGLLLTAKRRQVPLAGADIAPDQLAPAADSVPAGLADVDRLDDLPNLNDIQF